jgi:agmatinase
MATPPLSIGSMFGAADTATFLGLPARADVNGLRADIAILGADGATPYPSVGAYCAGAPAAIRAGIASYATTLAHHDFDLGGPLLGDRGATAVDCGDIAFDPADAPGNRARIRAAVAAILSRGAVPVVIGGDDSVPIPALDAFAGHGRFTILQIDAHIDWREEVGGERLGLSSTMRRASAMPHIAGIVQVGQRAVGSARVSDVADARAAGVRFVPARAVHEHGIAPVLDLLPRDANIIVSFDCDALDPSIMPAVIGPAPGGLTYWQAVGMIQGVAARGRLAGFNLVEFMPSRDIAGAGALVAARILANAVGVAARQARSDG